MIEKTCDFCKYNYPPYEKQAFEEPCINCDYDKFEPYEPPKPLEERVRELETENEQWKEEANRYQNLWCEAEKDIQTAKTEAYKEVFEKISDKSCVQEIKKGLFCKVVTLHDINALKKEMVGESNA